MDGRMEPFWQLLQRDSYGGEHPGVHALRRYTHDEMLAGRIDGATQDRIGQMLDDLSASLEACTGDIIGPRGPIPWDVLEVESLVDGGVYKRLIGRDRLVDIDGEPDGEPEEYDWVTAGGHATDEGVLHYAPIRVRRIAHRPDSVPTPTMVDAITFTLSRRGLGWTLTVDQLVERVRDLGTPTTEHEVVQALNWMRREGRAYQPSPRRWATRTEEQS